LKAITFHLPLGVQIPDGKQVGDTFQTMATLKIEASGKVTLEEIDGEGLNGDDDSDAANNAANDDAMEPGPAGLMSPGGMQAALMGGSSQGGS
jgi:hypothetical protein